MLELNNRLLIVDDNASIHEDFRKILGGPSADATLASAEALLFGETAKVARVFDLTMASQGEEAIELLRQGMDAGRPFALVFLDIRMPPGIDGVETARRLWALDPDLPIVICSAYSDYSWAEMAARLGPSERWILLKKPFENIEVLQMATALVETRALQQVARARQADLEALVAERTATLTATLSRLEASAAAQARADEEKRELERKLEQAQRLESLGVLAGGIAHDFNNILTGILGRASLARLGATPAELDQHLHEIELCTRRAAELCEQMMAYAGQGRVLVRELSINELVQEMGGLVHASVPRDVEFQIRLAPGEPVVRGDPTRLRQVVMNLVINGAEALGAEVRQLRLSTETQPLSRPELAAMTFSGEAMPGDYVIIQVSDTGSGMSPETIRRIFEPFFTTKFEGRGLGLCAALGIVRSHGGALDVESVPGAGSTFRVCLPMIAGSMAPPAAAVRAPRRSAAGAGRARLLVVDDEECVRKVTAYSLERDGYVVDVACDGLEALELVRRAPDAIDAVVMDMTMPRLGGAAALHAMREIRPDLPAVLISGFGQKQTLASFADQSHTVALEKPFDIALLCGAVAGVLQGRDGAGGHGPALSGSAQI